MYEASYLKGMQGNLYIMKSSGDNNILKQVVLGGLCLTKKTTLHNLMKNYAKRMLVILGDTW